MSKIAEWRQKQAEAIERYGNATREFFEAFIELHAIDLALSNAGVGLGQQPTFHEHADMHRLPRHPAVLPVEASTTRRSQERFEQILRDLTGGANHA